MTDPIVTTPSTLPMKLLARAAASPDRVAIRHKTYGVWREFTWAQYADNAAAAGLGLRSLGVVPGDKVAVHAENIPEWAYADLGAQGLGAICVGIYPTSPEAEVEYLLGHSESKVLIAEDEEQLDKAVAVWDRLPHLEHLVVVDPRGVKLLDDPRVITFAELIERGRSQPATDWADTAAGVPFDDVGIIVYTSGTTGPPKGAMITHANLHYSTDSFQQVFDFTEHDEVLSYLPLCHAAERLFTIVNGTACGYVMNYGEGGDAFNNDLREVQPTYFLGVPRIWEKMMASVEVRMSDSTWFKRANYRFWLRQGAKAAVERRQGHMGLLARVRYRLGWLFLFRALKERLGMSRCDKALSGAAPIAPQVLEFFWSIGVPIVEAYGQTENSAIATVMPRDDVRLGTVGTAAPGAELRIADDGEILTRGQTVFAGYLKNPEATADTVDPDGWLHTGDVGEIDADGFLRITDRKKDIIITAGGKNISPSEIENRLKVSPFVREAIVIGDRRKFLSALIGIEADTVGDWATRNQVGYTTYADLASQPEVVDLISGVVREANEEFAQVEAVKQFRMLTIELDHEDGQLTATQKVKRSAIADQFAELIEEIYS